MERRRTPKITTAKSNTYSPFLGAHLSIEQNRKRDEQAYRIQDTSEAALQHDEQLYAREDKVDTYDEHLCLVPATAKAYMRSAQTPTTETWSTTNGRLPLLRREGSEDTRTLDRWCA